MKTQAVYRELTELIDSGRFCVLETSMDGNSGAIASGIERHIAELPTASGESVEQRPRAWYAAE